MNQALVSRIQRLIPHQQIGWLLPQYRPWDQTHLRQEFATWTSRQRQQFDTWQDAWNAWTGATPNRPGRIDFWIRCSTCNGRMYAIQHGRMRPCWMCMGRRREHISTVALYARKPENCD